ncbi:hypothetical protein E1B28_010741 [Marasmius oreades]|uniref:TPR-like protein n=1 Tax=Marasmius oreades TaxID=181124 RepID=A0A9P7UPI0_9AGAR|nr:uncharacterized protein E1B28_010741 [Marasmius oreades]KAG7089030.1 hypothetical protein E1B28_010741 [Marasmius oreades]
MAQKLTRAQQLKDTANASFVKKEYKAASAKYSEAISLEVDDKDLNAVLYANRSACRLNQRKFLDAATDAIKATELNPTYAKAWARLATAKDMLKQPSESKSAWQKAVNALQRTDLTDDELKQKGQYERGLADAEEALKRAKADLNNQFENPVVVKECEAPWNIAFGLIPRLEREKNFESSAWVIASAYTYLEQGNMKMDSMVNDGEQTTVQLRALEPLSNAIMTDPRVFHLAKSEWISQLNEQLNAEVMVHGGWKDAGPAQIISEANARLAKEGWDKVRPALSVTIRAFILYAFVEGKLLRNFTTEVQYLGRAIEVLERGQKEWEHVSFKDRGAIFRDTFKRGVDKLYMDSLRELHDTEQDPHVQASILEELYEKSKSMIESVNNSPPPTRELDPAFAAAYYYHARGNAYAHQAFCCSRRGSQLTDSKEGLTLLQGAGFSYLKAADEFPEDDEWHTVYLTAAVENMLEGGAAVGLVLETLKRLRLAIPVAEKIWGAVMSRAGYKYRFQRALEFEPKLQRLLDEGKIMKDYGMCINLSSASAGGSFGDESFSVDLSKI